MKLKEFWFIIITACLVIAIILVVLFKFIIVRKEPGVLTIDRLDSIIVYDLHEKPNKLIDLFNRDKNTYLLLFELDNCYSCIFKGMNELNRLRRAGEHCIAIAVHDYIPDVVGFSQVQDFSPFFVLKKIDFYRHIHVSYMPVFFILFKGKVINSRFITP